MISKTVLNDTSAGDHTLDNSERASADEFQFFHREKRPKSSGDSASGVSMEETNKIESEAFIV